MDSQSEEETKMGTKETAIAKPAAATELVECRVVGVNYGKHLKGDIVKVPQREIDRVTRRDREGNVLDRVLISLDDEKKQITAEHQPTMERDLAEANRRKQAAWAESEQVRRAILDKARLERAKRVVEASGAEE
jgi:hypothetical protein